MKKKPSLSHSELLRLDSLIAFAQERGLSMKDKIDDDKAEAMAEVHAAMWEARHGGIMLSDKDKKTLEKIRKLTSQIEFAPTLGQLINLRADALRNQPGK